MDSVLLDTTRPGAKHSPRQDRTQETGGAGFFEALLRESDYVPQYAQDKQARDADDRDSRRLDRDDQRDIWPDDESEERFETTYQDERRVAERAPDERRDEVAPARDKMSATASEPAKTTNDDSDAAGNRSGERAPSSSDRAAAQNEDPAATSTQPSTLPDVAVADPASPGKTTIDDRTGTAAVQAAASNPAIAAAGPTQAAAASEKPIAKGQEVARIAKTIGGTGGDSQRPLLGFLEAGPVKAVKDQELPATLRASITRPTASSQPLSSLTSSTIVTLQAGTTEAENADQPGKAALFTRASSAATGEGKRAQPHFLAALSSDGKTPANQPASGNAPQPAAQALTKQPSQGLDLIPPAVSAAAAAETVSLTGGTGIGVAGPAHALTGLTGTTASSGTAAHTPAAPPPSQQVAVEIQRGVGAGLDKISIKLNPAELGRIDVKMELSDDGILRAVISAEKPETIDLLRRDAHALERALQESGLKTDSQSLSFQKQGEGSFARRDGDDAKAAGTRPDASSEQATADNQNTGRALHEGALDISV